MAAAGADKVRAASKKPQRLFCKTPALTCRGLFFAPEEASYITLPGGFAAATGGGRTESAHSASAPRVAEYASPELFRPRVPFFFEKPSSCPPVTRLSRTLFHALPVFLCDAASLSGPPRSMPGGFFPAKYSHRADEICFSAAVFTVIHQKDEEASLPFR